MGKIKKIISNNWIIWIIILQPILDIISYFQSKYLQQSFSWVFRIVILATVFIVSFTFSKNRKKLILYMMPFAIFFILHIINLYRVGELNIVLDVKYFILVFQMPILTILLIDYVKSKDYDLQKIKKAIACNFFIIAMSIFIAYVTNTYEHTYTDRGILGWFSGSNTPSMILCALAPWALYYISNFKKIFIYIFGASVVFIILYINSTTACYLTLIASFVVILLSLFVSKNETKRIGKIVITILFIIMVIFEYKFSSTFDKIQIAEQVNKENEQEIKNIVDAEEKENELEEIDFDNINFNDNKLIADILKTSYLYRDLMEIHGEDKVVEIMKNYLSAEALSNNRLCKVINSKIEFNESDKLTRILGIGYSRVTKYYILDMENDLQAIFYYYGYLGFAVYISFVLYFIIKLAVVFFKDFLIIRDKEYIILAFLILLLIAGGEYSGAFLRKPNANIYLSLYLVLLYLKLDIDCKKKINKKKISFLMLHLGYGGIETATINTVNALSNDYEVEIISFYKLEENQTKYINSNIKIKYLYNEGPNREAFYKAIKQKNIFKILKEGFKSIDILLKKRYLIKKEIKKSDSFAVVSTRYEFSKLLSEYGKNDVIKIAQEHHHHNNNKKYINILKYKYKNINYLFALTEGLKNDYNNFLKNNKYTKIMVVPNMINDNCKEISNINSKNIISISRLHEGKKINELIDIFAKIKDKQTKLYIIGDGEEQNKLKVQIKELNLEDRIIMTGYLNKEEQREYLLKSSIYAMTSISEGLPMVLLEAMNYGIPCIAYKTESGVSDIIKNNKNGFIIENRNEDEYIQKINELLEDSKLKEKMHKECIETCKDYSKDKIIKIWKEILKN